MNCCVDCIEEELINETDRVMYLLSNLKNHARIPTKSVLASKQEEEFQSLIHTVITSRNALYIQDEEGNGFIQLFNHRYYSLLLYE